MSKSRDDVIVGLDIGTTKVCAVVASLDAEGTPSIIGIGNCPSRGMRKGMVVDQSEVTDCIKKAVDEAELMAGVPIQAVYAGIAGGHIRSMNSHGVVAVKSKEGKIVKRDVERVLEVAQAVGMPPDREVIHNIPQEYVVDHQDGIKNPVGMTGVRLEARVHIVTAAVTAFQNIYTCCNNAGLDVLELVLEPLASGEAVLTEDERELGVALVDVGGGTTDLAVFCGGNIRHTSVVSFGGNDVVRDVAKMMRTSPSEAENLVKRYGCALSRLVPAGEDFELVRVGEANPARDQRRMLASVIESRVDEILEQVQNEVFKVGLDKEIPAGVVLTGGTVMLEGAARLAEDRFNLAVRTGTPLGITGLVDMVNSPAHATAVGLVKYAARYGHDQALGTNPERVWGEILKRLGETLKRFF